MYDVSFAPSESWYVKGPQSHLLSKCSRRVTPYFETERFASERLIVGALALSSIQFANGRFRRELPLPHIPANGVSCEGFRALAYESLQCRNPRAPRAALWVNRLWGGSGV